MEHLATSPNISEQDYLQVITDFAEAFTLDIPPNSFHAVVIGQISMALAGGTELSFSERSAISQGIQRGRARQNAELTTTDTIPRQIGRMQVEPLL